MVLQKREGNEQKKININELEEILAKFYLNLCFNSIVHCTLSVACLVVSSTCFFCEILDDHFFCCCLFVSLYIKLTKEKNKEREAARGLGG